MALEKVTKSLSSLKEEALSDSESMAAKAVRTIGGRTITPGNYEFVDDPEVTITKNQIPGSEPFYSVDVKATNGKMVSMAGLMRRTLGKDGVLEYINPWVGGYADNFDLATAVAGHKLVVSDEKATSYTTFYNRESHPDKPIPNGVAYKATLRDLPKAAAPAATAAPAAEPEAEQQNG